MGTPDALAFLVKNAEKVIVMREYDNLAMRGFCREVPCHKLAAAMVERGYLVVKHNTALDVGQADLREK